MMKLPIALAIFLLLASSQGIADAYKCRIADGRIEISSSPCASGSSTLKSQPDEKISEADRRQAERDIERMRDFVEKREAAQRAEAAAEREAAARQAKQAASLPIRSSYSSADECLNDMAQLALEAGQRAQMEATCRRLPNTTGSTGVSGPYPVYVPTYVYPPQHPPTQKKKPEEPQSAPRSAIDPFKTQTGSHPPSK